MVVSSGSFDRNLEYVSIFTTNNTAKRVRLSEFEKTSRARRGVLLLREVKTNPYKILKVFVNNNKGYFGVKLDDNSIMNLKNTEISIADRYKTGSLITKANVEDVFVIKDLEDYELKSEEDSVKEVSEKKENHQISLLEIDDMLKEIDDILK